MMLTDSTSNALQSTLALVVPLEGLGSVLITTVIFVLLGLVVFAVVFFVIVKASPFSVQKEITEDHNMALATVIASVIIGSAIIVAAAIHG